MDSYTQLHCRVSPGALPDAELPFQWLGFLASYLCALSTQADIKGLVGLLAEVMERVPLIRRGSESDPSFFLALTWDTFIILAFLFFFFFLSSEFTVDISSHHYLRVCGRNSCILKSACLAAIYSAHCFLILAVPSCSSRVIEVEFP